MPKQKLSQKRFKLSSPRVALPLLFAAVFVGFGLWKALSSSAATVAPTFTSYGRYDHLQTFYTKGVTTVSDTVSGYTANVTQIDSNDVLMYDSSTWGGPFTIEKQACYAMRSVDRSNPGKVTISGGVKNSRTLTVISNINDGFADDYRDYCVSTSTTGSLSQFDVKHVSGGSVNVYSKRLYFQHCPDFNNPCD